MELTIERHLDDALIALELVSNVINNILTDSQLDTRIPLSCGCLIWITYYESPLGVENIIREIIFFLVVFPQICAIL